MAVLIFTLLALIFGIILGYFAIRFRVVGNPVVDKIDEILPQTQCGQCGYPGCRPYATAIASEEADINLCPPGGESGVRALADLLGREAKPVVSEKGVVDDSLTLVAVIEENLCIGCTKCIQVCPVDAIVGAAKHEHTVLNAYCTGCELCLPPLCPIEDCIVMKVVEPSISDWKWSKPVTLGEGHTA